mmetsp:Transcript_24075/g.68598  ORF Transcript_24075/g.68598 Transcript_24075/m.68598 type:complete len:217 (+) Transcript_24075:17-667(+)
MQNAARMQSSSGRTLRLPWGCRAARAVASGPRGADEVALGPAVVLDPVLLRRLAAGEECAELAEGGARRGGVRRRPGRAHVGEPAPGGPARRRARGEAIDFGVPWHEVRRPVEGRRRARPGADDQERRRILRGLVRERVRPRPRFVHLQAGRHLRWPVEQRFGPRAWYVHPQGRRLLRWHLGARQEARQRQGGVGGRVPVRGRVPDGLQTRPGRLY